MSLNLIPQPLQSLGQTQNSVLTNFTTIDAAFTVNHVPYNDGSGNQGKHAYVTFPVPAQTMVPPFLAGELGLYSFLNATTTYNELYLNKQINYGFGTVVGQVPWTAGSIGFNPGWSYLPSGLIIQFGSFTSSVGNNVITYPLAYPTGPISGFADNGSGNNSAICNVVGPIGTVGIPKQNITIYTSAVIIVYWFSIGR